MAKKKRKSNSYKKKIEALSKVSQTITSSLYLKDILKLIVMVTAEVMNSKICSLLLLNEEKNELIIRATQSVSEAYNKKPNIKLGEGIAGLVVKDNKPIAVLDVKEDPRYRNREIAKKENLCSLLAVPLCVKDKVIGALNSYTSVKHKFSREEINILTSVANQAAVAIENAGLLLKSQLIEEELKTRKVVERAKGILMYSQGISEQEAYKKIQKQAMNMRRSMREIAEAIILAKELE
ncbi:MAG: GAF and ANTAR domain-containing protein [Candidatus Omnitrophica bacterium]|nr:GAF and ANTAR domain-containing protein [Candidatus Omnitrophota bacterium]